MVFKLNSVSLEITRIFTFESREYTENNFAKDIGVVVIVLRPCFLFFQRNEHAHNFA